MNFQAPPLRPEGSAKGGPREGLSWLEEYLDGKDEILLYITASLGVILPGVVYILYYKCHAYYEKYAKRKEEEKYSEELAQSEAVVIVLGQDDGKAAKFAKRIHLKLCEEMVRKPDIWMADKLEVKKLTEFKGFCIFFVETLEGAQPSPSTEWFLEWLEDLAADSKLKKKTHFDKIRFSVVGFGSSKDGQMGFNKVSRTLLKRMKIVGSKQIIEVAIFDTLDDEKEIESKLDSFALELLDAMDRHLPGAERYSDSEEETSSNGTEDSDFDEINDKKGK